MAVAQALAVTPDLLVHEADPEADAAALLRLAQWCHRFSPLVAPCPPDGLWLDINGCAALFGGEPALLQTLLTRLRRDGLQVRAAVADTPGAAHGLARHDPDPVRIVPPGEHVAAIAALPLAALRMPAELEATLRRLGFGRVGDLGRIPRALLARRFGPLPGLRLDQALGRVTEPLTFLQPETHLQHRLPCLEPLLTAEALAIGVEHLVQPLCTRMDEAGLGARQLELICERVDRQVVALRVGTVRPTRDARHLIRLLTERLDTLDPGPGVESMQLMVALAEPLDWTQQEGDAPIPDMSPLVDRLSNRLGAGRVYSLAPIESAIPERAVGRIPPEAADKTERVLHRRPPDGSPAGVSPQATPAEPILAPSEQIATLPLSGCDALEKACDMRPAVSLDEPPPILPWKAARPKRPSLSNRGGPDLPWPTRLQAPARLLTPPRPIEALAALPDHPPVAFTWRRRRHRVRRADGPERIHGEWWRHDSETRLVRDYFQVEDESGQRFWLFREGDGCDLETGQLAWFLHGVV